MAETSSMEMVKKGEGVAVRPKRVYMGIGIYRGFGERLGIERERNLY